MTINSLFQIDPVCGMAVSPRTAKSVRWEGRNHYFCEVACRDIFRRDPARWSEPMRHVDDAVPSA
jgi:YHS domain-containing protein